jgi:hypothetical protein
MQRRTIAFSLAAAGALLVACQSQAPQASPPPVTQAAQEGAEYMVTVTGTWTAATHPLEYPEAGVVTGPHFSGLIGASHADGYAIFKEGTPPTPGLERLSEEGKHSPLDEEIKAAIAGGKAGMLFESDPIRDFAKPATTKVRVTDRFPKVSAVAMIAPSPDWFAGAMDVDLKENGAWVGQKSVTLYAWDSGGDDGTTYKAKDADTNPKKPTSKAATAHFVKDGVAVPVGTLVFSKQ